MIFRRDRFGDLVRRQLDLFAEDDAELLAEVEEAELAWNQADRDQAEDTYGDYQLVLDAITERLEELRDTYAATLDGDSADEYERSFDRQAAKRYPRSFGNTSRP